MNAIEVPGVVPVHDGRPRVFMAIRPDSFPDGSSRPSPTPWWTRPATTAASSSSGESIYAGAHDAMADRRLVERDRGQSMPLTLHVSRSLGRRSRRRGRRHPRSEGRGAARRRPRVVKWLPFNRDTWKVGPRPAGPARSEDAPARHSTPDRSTTWPPWWRWRVRPVSWRCSLRRTSASTCRRSAATSWCVRLTSSSVHTWECCGDAGNSSTSCRPTRCDALPIVTGEMGDRHAADRAAGGSGRVRRPLRLAYRSHQGGHRAATNHEARLVMHLIDGIQAIPGTTVHGITNPNRVGERVPTVSRPTSASCRPWWPNASRAMASASGPVTTTPWRSSGTSGWTRRRVWCESASPTTTPRRRWTGVDRARVSPMQLAGPAVGVQVCLAGFRSRTDLTPDENRVVTRIFPSPTWISDALTVEDEPNIPSLRQHSIAARVAGDRAFHPASVGSRTVRLIIARSAALTSIASRRCSGRLTRFVPRGRFR